MTPDVSILIPCHNTERWIGDAVQSALDQTGPRTEVIVVDDGSTDASPDILAAFGDRIRLERTEARGANAARNRLVELARGEWLQYLDADDLLLPSKIAREWRYLEQSPETDVLFSPTWWEEWGSDRRPAKRLTAIPKPWDIWTLLPSWGLPQTAGALIRRSSLVEAGGWNERQPCAQDHEMYFQLLRTGARARIFHVPGAAYRQWSGGTLSRRDPALFRRTLLSLIDDIEEHLLTNGLMTPQRSRAIAVRRIRTARNMFQEDPDEAVRLAQRVQESEPRLSLPPLPAFPLSYRLSYRALGFRRAERVSRILGRLKGIS